MSRSWSSDRRRGQTEPLAALIAVAAMALALGLYGGYVTDVLPGTSDESLGDPTIERVWETIGSDGAFDPDATPIESAIDERTLPAGKAVYINVTVLDPEGITVVDEAYFTSNGEYAGESPSKDIPDSAEVASRSIPVVRADGVVDGGNLTVEVWD